MRAHKRPDREPGKGTAVGAFASCSARPNAQRIRRNAHARKALQPACVKYIDANKAAPRAFILGAATRPGWVGDNPVQGPMATLGACGISTPDQRPTEELHCCC